MPAQAAVVLATPKLLDIHLRRRMLDHVGHDAGPFDNRLSDAGVVRVLVEQHAADLNPLAFIDIAEIKAHDVALANAILPRTIFKHCIHKGYSARRPPVGNRQSSR